MSNPYFQKNPAFSMTKPGQPAPDLTALEHSYAAPDANSFDTGRMSYEGTVTKTAGLLVLLFGSAAFTWLVAPVLAIPGAIAAIVLMLVLTFKKTPNAGLTIAYAAFEGMFLGGLSWYLESVPGYEGIAFQALLATGVTTAVCLWLYRSGRVRVTAGYSRVLIVGLISYSAFSLVNLIVMLTTSTPGFGLRSSVEVGGIKLGLIIGVIAVLLASMTLISDFDGVKRGVERGAPAIFEWAAAFGLIITLVWLYLEFIRIFAISRDN